MRALLRCQAFMQARFAVGLRAALCSVTPVLGHFEENFMKKLSFAIAANTGLAQEVAFAFLRQAAQSHSARMGNAHPARKAEIRAHYRAWLTQVRAEVRLPYYGAYFGQAEEYFA